MQQPATMQRRDVWALIGGVAFSLAFTAHIWWAGQRLAVGQCRVYAGIYPRAIAQQLGEEPKLENRASPLALKAAIWEARLGAVALAEVFQRHDFVSDSFEELRFFRPRFFAVNLKSGCGFLHGCIHFKGHRFVEGRLKLLTAWKRSGGVWVSHFGTVCSAKSERDTFPRGRSPLLRAPQRSTSCPASQSARYTSRV